MVRSLSCWQKLCNRLQAKEVADDPDEIGCGFLIGIVQSFGVIWIDPRWQNLLIFSTLLVILIVRPTGVFGTKTR